jgi:hypothetical protein
MAHGAVLHLSAAPQVTDGCTSGFEVSFLSLITRRLESDVTVLDRAGCNRSTVERIRLIQIPPPRNRDWVLAAPTFGSFERSGSPGSAFTFCRGVAIPVKPNQPLLKHLRKRSMTQSTTASRSRLAKELPGLGSWTQTCDERFQFRVEMQRRIELR